jgi:hypothetical protein
MSIFNGVLQGHGNGKLKAYSVSFRYSELMMFKQLSKCDLSICDMLFLLAGARSLSHCLSPILIAIDRALDSVTVSIFCSCSLQNRQERTAIVIWLFPGRSFFLPPSKSRS